jgi:hypothetical protein
LRSALPLCTQHYLWRNAQSLPRILSAGLQFNYLLRLLSHDDVDLLPAHELDHRSPLVDPLASIISHHSHRVVEVDVNSQASKQILIKFITRRENTKQHLI